MLRLGIIGAGGNAQGHARFYAEQPRTKVVAVADPDSSRASALAAEVGARALADYRAFLDDVDAVVISSPNHFHCEQAVTAARAGKHVYCEKPMGLNLDQAKQIAHAICQAKVKSAIGFSTRFSAEVQTFAELRDAGRLGELISIFSRRLFYMEHSQVPAWRRDHTTSGGLLLEINVHELEWMVWLGGEIDSVYARVANTLGTGHRANDHAWVVMNFANGAVGTHEGSWLSPAISFYRGVYGSAGSAVTNEWGQGVLYATDNSNRAPVDLAPAQDPRLAFVASILDDAPPTADAAYGLKIAQVVEAIFLSAERNEVVHVDELCLQPTVAVG